MSTPRWMLRFTVQGPRMGLAVAEYAMACMFGIQAYYANNPYSLILCLIPIPFLAIAAIAETLRATDEERP